MRPFGFRNGSYYYVNRSRRPEYVRIVDAASPNAKPLETFSGIGPSWSPDGKSIAFKRRHPGTAAQNDYDLVVRSIATGEERLYPTTLGFTGNGSPTWTLDGKAVMTGLHNAEGNKPAQRIDLQTGEWTAMRTTGNGLPAISLDGRTLYNIRNGPPIRIMANDIATGQERELLVLPTMSNVNGARIALSPDGRTLAAAWMDNAPGQGPHNKAMVHVGTVSADGGDFREVYKGPEGLYGSSSVAWSRDGHSIFFNQEQPAGKDPQWGLMRVPLDGSGAASVLGRGPTNAGIFRLSPDGTRFAIDDTGEWLGEVWALDNILSALK
jgi:Tol biopolymer transport system component